MKVLRNNIISISILPRLAFTLAEVLIVLGIIGIVAEMTIPTLVKQTQDLEFKSAWKKNFSVVSSATKMLMNDNGGSMQGVFDNGIASMLSNYSKYLQIIKTCSNNSVSEGCISAAYYKGLDGSGTGGTDPLSSPGIVLKDGTILIFYSYNSANALNCDIVLAGATYPMNEQCGMIYVDVNGQKRPNVMGRDLFAIWIMKTGAYAPGAKGSGLTNITDFSYSCNPSDGGYTWSGYGCAAKYLME